jgi:hypothetical protein
MIEQSLFSVLSTQVPGQRFYPLILPNEPTLPAAVYSIVGATASPTFTTAGLTKYRVEISSYGKTYHDAVTLRSQVKAALNGYTDANMTIEWTRSTDFFEHELLSYRCLSEYYILSTL